AECAEMGWGQFKPLLTEVVVAALAPIQQRYRELMAEPGYVQQLIRDNALKARAVAEQTLQICRQAMGFLPF
ncbi:MAG: hypothetical protein Q6J78_06780, partial [Thermostichales cyanobacterium SRBZ-1_bins_19]